MSIFWFIIIVILIILEVMTVNLVSIWAVIGGIAALIASFITTDVTIQIVVFLVVTTITLVLTRGLVDKMKGKTEIINLDVKGKTAIVTKEISADAFGRVKFEGKEWTAKANETIPIDTKVEILDIEGVKLVVRKGEK